MLGYSVAGYLRRRTASALLQLVGVGCLMIVVFTHVAEALRLFEVMRWGEPDSAGHYLDLASAMVGVGLLTVAVALRLVRARSSPP